MNRIINWGGCSGLATEIARQIRLNIPRTNDDGVLPEVLEAKQKYAYYKSLDEKERMCAVLTETIRVLKQRGWCQNKMIDGEGRVCLSQATGIASTNLFDIRFAAETVIYLKEKLGRLSTWNDAEGQTRAKILMTLALMIRDLRKGRQK